jgi:hypothetical protein
LYPFNKQNAVQVRQPGSRARQVSYNPARKLNKCPFFLSIPPMPSCIQTILGTRTSSMAPNHPSRYRARSEKCASDSGSTHRRSSQDFLTIKRGASHFQIYAPRDPKNARHGHVYSLTTPAPRKQCPRSSETALKKAHKIAQLCTP